MHGITEKRCRAFLYPYKQTKKSVSQKDTDMVETIGLEPMTLCL